MSANEFSRPQRLDRLGIGETRVEIAAEADERTALAKRFGLLAVDRLEADYRLRRDAAGVIATGDVLADVTQACVATGEPVRARVAAPFALHFVPEPETAGDEEIELDEAECDIVFFDGGAIDLGEAAAETLALALDPFPRSPGAAAALREAGVLSEEEASPFAALAGLRDKLGG